MKIGIVTFFCVPNYGAMLQAYALWHYLEDRGHEVEFIDYDFCRKLLPSFFRSFFTRHSSAICKRLKMYFERHMLDFARSYPCTRRFSSYSSLVTNCPKYDVLIVGSDQMWNPKWLSGERLRYVMLDFAPVNCRRISCSVSFGTDTWPDSPSSVLAGQMLRNFSAISVREDSGIKLTKKLSGRDDVKCLIDPTMLYTSDYYSKLFSSHNSKNVSAHPYIFKYFLDHPEQQDNQNIVASIMSETRITILKSDKIPIEGNLSFLGKKLGITSRRTVEDWLHCLADASFVCTNSFHGTVFSLVFHRPFVSVLLENVASEMNKRILSLLGKVGLSDRAIYPNEVSKIPEIIKSRINWNFVCRNIDYERIKYMKFIEEVGL